MYQILNPKLCGKDRAVNLQVKQLSKSTMIAKQMQMVNKADLYVSKPVQPPHVQICSRGGWTHLKLKISVALIRFSNI